MEMKRFRIMAFNEKPVHNQGVNYIKMPQSIRYKKLDQNVPDLKRHTSDAAGYDVYNAAKIDRYSYPHTACRIPTGIAVEIPKGFYGILGARSSVRLENELGRFEIEDSVIDSDYRGELHIQMSLGLYSYQEIPKYTRLAQLVIVPCFAGDMLISDVLSETERGDKGFGSTGR